ncbi:MAG: hypoxanthine phosphoribosyltransferase [Clostridia bacterium]
MKLHKEMDHILIPYEKVQARVKEIAQEITNDYKDKTMPLMVCILKGAVMFFADLTRAVDIDVNLEFMAISTYGSSTRSSGEVRLVKDLDCSVDGRNVIIVEDIIDTGITMDYLIKMLYTRGALSVKVCTLLSKPNRRKIEVPIDYVGFEIPDEFVIGYGLDLDERFRNLEDVGIYKEIKNN